MIKRRPGADWKICGAPTNGDPRVPASRLYAVEAGDWSIIGFPLQKSLQDNADLLCSQLWTMKRKKGQSSRVFVIEALTQADHEHHAPALYPRGVRALHVHLDQALACIVRCRCAAEARHHTRPPSRQACAGLAQAAIRRIGYSPPAWLSSPRSRQQSLAGFCAWSGAGGKRGEQSPSSGRVLTATASTLRPSESSVGLAGWTTL